MLIIFLIGVPPTSPSHSLINHILILCVRHLGNSNTCMYEKKCSVSPQFTVLIILK